MSEVTEELEQVPVDTLRPYIVFERVRNKGIREKIAADGNVIQKGEHKDEWKCFLADERGELHTWATVAGMQGYVAKGYVPIALHGFEEYLARKDPNQDLVQECRALYVMFSRTVGETKRLREIEAEAESLKAERDKLLADMEAQRKELEALKKQSEKDKAAQKAAEGKTVVESTKGGHPVG